MVERIVVGFARKCAHQQTVDALQKNTEFGQTNKHFIGVKHWMFPLSVSHGCEIGNLFEHDCFYCVRCFDLLMHQTKNRRP